MTEVKLRFTYTHKGWYFICPVLLGNLEAEDDSPIVRPRSWIFEPLMWCSEAMMFLGAVLVDLLRLGEPRFPFVVTGQLRKPVTR